MTNSQWVTLHYLFARESHQSSFISWPTVGEWHNFISLPGHIIYHVSLPITNSWWVTQTMLYFFARQSHQSHHILWPNSEWVDTALFLCQAVSSIISHDQQRVSELSGCFISLPSSLINHGVSSYDEQLVSANTTLFLCQAVSSIMIHVSSHDEQYVSDTALFLCQAVSSIMPHPMTNSACE